MSGNTLNGADKQGRDKITVRVNTHLKEQYKDQVDSMSHDLREHIQDSVESYDPDDHDTPRQPPVDNQYLRRAYKQLCTLARGSDKNTGIVHHDSVTKRLSGGPRNLSKDEVERNLLRPLRRRGYIAHSIDTLTGKHRTWKIRGWNDGD
jgi:hypothetical protein